MQNLLKISVLAAFTVSLTGCAFTKGVAQSAYDEQAQKECLTTSGANDSIHTTANSSCSGGSYDPKPKTE